uniref:GTP cyclohydrolase FolE2 n=1 Tax=Candidatus Kentrum sp. FM TaxID=2126340 RepID=A0A450TZY0_9GAMM|nr:MAG: GTP cyclohydrolase I [Candidatus Kentron sp. FM]VFJ75542.1 MAG: GTP cyclohydrolase I [Candidatus Kentron sp. FM]VFK20093.1 MAG: GTP cyclohydrolase I [Candidatus Kentron sp. FM]
MTQCVRTDSVRINNANTGTDASESGKIADVQGTTDLRRIPIQQVGIKGIRHPIQVRDRANTLQHTIATFNMYVNLPHNFKGTHMSRFVEILNNHEYEITVESFTRMLFEMTEILDAESGQIEMMFPYFVDKVAPISKVRSLMDYEVTLTGKLVDGQSYMYIKVIVPVTSLCPCSKEISHYGAHNQRSHVTLEVRTHTFVWIEELIDLIENQASSQVYGLLKRPDEKFVTERAFDHPKFVEDMVRDVAQLLNKDDRIDAYIVESENFESIHNHSAYALVEKDKLKNRH